MLRLPPFALRRTLALLCPLLCAASLALAQTVSGPDWLVCYNLPTQDARGHMEGEFAIRDCLLRRINQLTPGDRAALATFTLSGDSFKSGMATPLLWALSRALDRDVHIHFVAYRYIDHTREFFNGLSLSNLAHRTHNPMTLSVSPRKPLMHHKIALFDYGNRDQWIFVGSGNFTGAANTRQWNIALLLRNPTLYKAYAAEMAEFRAGRFGKAKHRDHDRTGFRLPDSWGNSWVRFSPFPDRHDTAETDIRALLDAAEEEIVFAMHHFNRPPLRRALVNAANRGLRVVGVIPESDRGTNRFAVSTATVRYFAKTNLYTSTNRVHLLPARASAIGTDWDAGQLDLVHLKYALIDPASPRPIVIHGASNWTASGLCSPVGNDESILFLRHAGIARAFLEQFQRMTAF
ncbi:MAG: phospholipase D-like domain-containing protein [Kiritimatiellae bacterium]|nr:phospholipase D-like domain-containing protein [Kiritimatiellia bacterium]MDD4341939.1 phospholipase D-like domain-containing protein [Kiritimatiellia bacterium]